MGRMKRERLILDGYNVINAWPELVALKDIDHARDKLADLMAEYGAYRHYDVTIVFDALFTNFKKTCRAVNANLQIVFTDEGETADSYIEKLAYQLVKDGYEVYVVTSDWAEQTVILGAGAYRMSSRELRKAVLKTKRKIAEEYMHKPELVSRRELGCRIKDDVARKLDELRKRK